MAKKVVAKNAIKRKPGKLYFVDGNGSVVEADMNRKGGKRGRSVCSTKKKAAPKKRAVKKAAPKKRAVKKAAPKRKPMKKTARKKTYRKK